MTRPSCATRSDSTGFSGGADYPHFEGTWPHTDLWLKETFGGLPTHAVRTVLAENPARVFGLDLDGLGHHATSVGPLVEEIKAHEPSATLWRS